MNIDRRFALKSLATVGLAMSTINWANARNIMMDALIPSVIPIVTGSIVEASFLIGVRTGTVQRGWVMDKTIHLRGLDSADVLHVITSLHTGSPAILVGLTDDASAVLILDLVRSMGGQVLSSTQFRLMPDSTASQVATDLGRQLTSQPTEIGHRFDLPAHGASHHGFCCFLNG